MLAARQSPRQGANRVGGANHVDEVGHVGEVNHAGAAGHVGVVHHVGGANRGVEVGPGVAADRVAVVLRVEEVSHVVDHVIGPILGIEAILVIEVGVSLEREATLDAEVTPGIGALHGTVGHAVDQVQTIENGVA